MPRTDLSQFGRFSEPALLILVSLASGPKHGYAMMDDIEVLTGTRPGPGTLYGALDRLEREAMIEPLASEDRRVPYRLTDAGSTALGAQLASIRDVAAVGLRRLAST